MTTRIPGLRARKSVPAAVGLSILLGSCASVAVGTPTTEPEAVLLTSSALASATPLEPLAPDPTWAPAAIPFTEPGCCSRWWWSAEGDRVLFVDDPPGEPRLGIYAASISGGPVEREGPPTEDPGLVAAWLREVAGETSLPAAVPEGARSVAVSPDGSSVAWTEGASSVTNFDLRQRTLWTADAGSGERLWLGTLIGGDLLGWSADGLRLVVTGSAAGLEGKGLWTVPLAGGDRRLVQTAERVRSPLRSPRGNWVVFYRAFEEDPEAHGTWVVEIEGNRVIHLADLASYRWRDNTHLLYFPYAPDTPMKLLELAVETGESRKIAEEGSFPGGIAANDWSVSPTGDWIAYRSAADGRLWAVRIAGR